MFGSMNEAIKRNLISVKLVTVRGLPKFFDMIFLSLFRPLGLLNFCKNSRILEEFSWIFMTNIRGF